MQGYVRVADDHIGISGAVPNSVMRDLLQFLERQLGHNALRGVLNMAGTEDYFWHRPANDMQEMVKASDYLAVLQALADYYDERGAIAIIRELGRYTVKRALIRNLSLAEQQRSKTSGRELLKTALQSFAQSTAVRDRRLIILQDSGDMLLVSMRCPPCWTNDGSDYACQVAVGALRGSLELISGSNLRVRPIACCFNAAHHCVFEVSRPNRYR